MNLAVPAIGFENLSSSEFRKMILDETERISNEFLRGASAEKLPQLRIEKLKRYQRAYVTIYTGHYTGVTCLWKDNEEAGEDPELISIAPFVDGQVLNILPMDQLVVDRMVRDESYVVDAGPVVSGMTLVFSLQNVEEYLKNIERIDKINGEERLFSVDGRSKLGDWEMRAQGGAARFGALALRGHIVLPLNADRKTPYPYLPPYTEVHTRVDVTDSRILEELKGASGKSDWALEKQDALMSKASARLKNGEDFYTLVDTLFMPCGSECDIYNVIGEIEEVLEDKNRLTGASMWILNLNCNGTRMTVCVPKKTCEGIPLKGRRFDGDIWLRGSVHLIPVPDEHI